MKSSMESPDWLCNGVKMIRVGRGNVELFPIAEKIAGEMSLAPLWRAIDKEVRAGGLLSAESTFRHLVVQVEQSLIVPAGYRAMSPAQLDEWRTRTQDHAIRLLADLTDGYPHIDGKQDDSSLVDDWVAGAAIQVASEGRGSCLDDLPELRGDEKFDSRLPIASAVACRLPMILNQLIYWLEYEAADGHAVTHAVSKNLHRNSFMRHLTTFFEENLDSPMRAHVYSITALFFDMGGLDVGDVKKVAPAGGGKLPRPFTGKHPWIFTGKLPGDEIP